MPSFNSTLPIYLSFPADGLVFVIVDLIESNEIKHDLIN